MATHIHHACLLATALVFLVGCLDTSDDYLAGSSRPSVPSLANPMTAAETDAFTAALNHYRSTGASCGSSGVFGPQEPLRWNALLTDAAQVHSNDQFLNDVMTHTGSDGSNPGDRVEAQGYYWLSVRENVASGYFRSIEDLAWAWMESPGHCANMMAGNVTEFGIAVTRFDSGYGYWTLKLARPF